MACLAGLSNLMAAGVSSRLQPLQCGSRICSRASLSFSKKFLNASNWRKMRAEFDDTLLHNAASVVPKVTSGNLNILPVDNVQSVGTKIESPYHRGVDTYNIQEAVLDEEFWAAAWLRAESYTEDLPYLRYIDSYRKKFAEQEFNALKRRCLGRQGQSIKCICLIAVRTKESQDGSGNRTYHTLRDRVVGTLDISLRQLLHGETYPKEVMSGALIMGMKQSHRCGYVANVCVARSSRRKGIASSLLKVAVEAARNWSLKEIYVHVNIGNDAARQLYIGSGFQLVEEATSLLSLEQKMLLSLSL